MSALSSAPLYHIPQRDWSGDHFFLAEKRVRDFPFYALTPFSPPEVLEVTRAAWDASAVKHGKRFVPVVKRGTHVAPVSLPPSSSAPSSAGLFLDPRDLTLAECDITATMDWTELDQVLWDYAGLFFDALHQHKTAGTKVTDLVSFHRARLHHRPHRLIALKLWLHFLLPTALWDTGAETKVSVFSHPFVQAWLAVEERLAHWQVFHLSPSEALGVLREYGARYGIAFAEPPRNSLHVYVQAASTTLWPPPVRDGPSLLHLSPSPVVEYTAQTLVSRALPACHARTLGLVLTEIMSRPGMGQEWDAMTHTMDARVKQLVAFHRRQWQILARACAFPSSGSSNEEDAAFARTSLLYEKVMTQRKTEAREAAEWQPGPVTRAEWRAPPADVKHAQRGMRCQNAVQDIEDILLGDEWQQKTPPCLAAILQRTRTEKHLGDTERRVIANWFSRTTAPGSPMQPRRWLQWVMGTREPVTQEVLTNYAAAKTILSYAPHRDKYPLTSFGCPKIVAATAQGSEDAPLRCPFASASQRNPGVCQAQCAAAKDIPTPIHHPLDVLLFFAETHGEENTK